MKESHTKADLKRWPFRWQSVHIAISKWGIQCPASRRIGIIESTHSLKSLSLDVDFFSRATTVDKHHFRSFLLVRREVLGICSFPSAIYIITYCFALTLPVTTGSQLSRTLYRSNRLAVYVVCPSTSLCNKCFVSNQSFIRSKRDCN